MSIHLLNPEIRPLVIAARDDIGRNPGNGIIAATTLNQLNHALRDHPQRADAFAALCHHLATALPIGQRYAFHTKQEPEPPAPPKGPEPAVPNQVGPGSSRSAWAAYAQWHNVTVTERQSREDIITALSLKGIITK